MLDAMRARLHAEFVTSQKFDGQTGEMKPLWAKNGPEVKAFPERNPGRPLWVFLCSAKKSS
jgi:hypothetical protein